MSDKFYITLSEDDQAMVHDCLSAGVCENAGELIRQGIELKHRQLNATRTENQRLRVGMTSLIERLERYQH